jgi:heme o synthase
MSLVAEERPATGLPLSMGSKMGSYVLLAKPRIVVLVMLTGLVAMVLEGSLLDNPLRFAAVLLGIMLSAGAANALNQFWDRDIDAIMARTRSKRPIPAGKMPPRNALWFGSASAVPAIWLLQAAGNILAAFLGIGAIVIYVFVYTLWLKRRTSLNIVIGGIAGAIAPLIGWAAGAGDLSTVPLLMALVIFLWTPPHFWALALYTKKEYTLAGIPMLPVVAGEKITRWQITAYIGVLLPVTAYIGIHAGLGRIYLLGTTLLGIVFIRRTVALWLRKDHRSAQELFVYSIIYLAGVFALMLVPKW